MQVRCAPLLVVALVAAAVGCTAGGQDSIVTKQRDALTTGPSASPDPTATDRPDPPAFPSEDLLSHRFRFELDGSPVTVRMWFSSYGEPVELPVVVDGRSIYGVHGLDLPADRLTPEQHRTRRAFLDLIAELGDTSDAVTAPMPWVPNRPTIEVRDPTGASSVLVGTWSSPTSPSTAGW